MGETYNVKWGSYPDHVTSLLHDITDTNEFADVTLVCADMVIIQAHKLVLSACSKFFNFILKAATNSDSRPIIYLKGIQSMEMSYILQFMYTGETSFPRDITNSFLDVANLLEIKAFSDYPEEKHEKNETQMKKDTVTSLAVPKIEHLTSISSTESLSSREPISATLDDDENLSPFAKDFNIELRKSEPQEQQEIEIAPKEVEQNTLKPQNEDKPKTTVNVSKMKRLKVKNYCDLCGFKSSIDSRKHIRIHKITKHKYKLCPNCEYIAPDEDKLNQHFNEAHKETSDSNTFIFSKSNSKYRCDHCDFTTKNQRLLKQHTTMKHEGYRRLTQLTDKFTIVEKENLRLYSCKECEYENPNATNIKRHIETKHLDMCFPCDQCGYIGTRMQSLRYHINTVHEKLLQHSCKKCEEKFIHYEALRSHVDTVHLGISYDCKQCKSKFTRPGNLNKHVRLFH